MPHFYFNLSQNIKNPELKKYNSIKKDIYWARMVDMGAKLINQSANRTKLVICDFDGTILDLKIDWDTLRKNINETLTLHNIYKKVKLLNHDLNEIYESIKNSKKRNALKKIIDKVIYHEECKFIRQYIINSDVSRNISILKNNKIQIAIYSDNSEKIIKSILQNNNIIVDFIKGRESRLFLKPRIDGLEKIIIDSKAKPEETIYIGDTEKDLLVASQMGIEGILISKKKDSKFHETFKSFSEIIKYLNIKTNDQS